MNPEKLYFIQEHGEDWWGPWYEKHGYITALTGDVTCSGPALHFIKIDLTFSLPKDSSESK